MATISTSDLSTEPLPIGARMPTKHAGRKVMGIDFPSRKLIYFKETPEDTIPGPMPGFNFQLWLPDWSDVVFMMANLWAPIGASVLEEIDFLVGEAAWRWRRRMPKFTGRLIKGSNFEKTETDTSEGFEAIYEFNTDVNYYKELDTGFGLPTQRTVSGSLASWVQRRDEQAGGVGPSKFIEGGSLWIGRGKHPKSSYFGRTNGLGLTASLTEELKAIHKNLEVKKLVLEGFKEWVELFQILELVRVI